ncbi:MAG: hypothetical protein WD424_00440 [Paenibacillaceae bacterium]
MTHYTIQQWQAYIQGGEFDCTSMDTHLLECDDCTEFYLVALEELHEYLPELTNITAFTEGVLERIGPLPKYKPITQQPIANKKWYINTLFHYTIAASLTLVLVGSGIFDHMVDRVLQISQETEQAQKTSVSDQLTNKAGKWLDSIPAKHVKKEGNP